jgi:acyl-CoA synthetase (AMP-forming)/AMP-acid ligase II
MSLLDQLPARTLPALIRELADLMPSRRAVLADDGELTYAELDSRCRSFARALRSTGVNAGGGVGVLLPNGIRWFIAVLGAHYAGATAVPLNTWAKADELKHCVDVADVMLVVADRKIIGSDFESILRSGALIDECDRSGRHFLGTRFWPAATPLPEGMRDEPVDLPEIHETATAYVLFTSGSTALPKGVPLIHRDLLTNGYEIGKRHRFTSDDKLWIASPFFFSMGSVNAVPSVLTHGASFCVQERYDVEPTLELLERERCSVYYGLPPVTRALLASPTLKYRDLSSLRTGMGAMSRRDKIEAITQLGIAGMCSVYGSTEVYTLCTMTEPDDPLEVKIATQGRPLPSQEVRIVADEELAPRGVVGEIEVRGCTTPGYLGLFGAERARYWRDGWFRTGDLGSFGDDGRLSFVGRISETVKTNGILVAPADVEASIIAHPGVRDVVVFGLPDERRGESLVAVVVPAKWDRQSLDELLSQLPAHVRSRSASYKVPQFIWFVQAQGLPLTDTGKLKRRGLVDLALSEDWRSSYPSGGVVASLDPRD